MPSLMRSFFRLTVLFLLVIFCASCSRTSKQVATANPIHAFGGEEWLSWTPAQRDRYVYGYIVGYQSGFFKACEFADEHSLFDDHIPPGPGEEGVINVPGHRCRTALKSYSRVTYTQDKGVSVNPYPEIITEMYEKHPDSRSAMYQLLMEQLSEGQVATAEDLYKAQLNKWPNAWIE
jgi:hypothetical protein